MHRRDFLSAIGVGSAGAALGVPKVLAATSNGVLVESESEFGGFVVEKLSPGQFPYECDPDVLQPMSEKRKPRAMFAPADTGLPAARRIADGRLSDIGTGLGLTWSYNGRVVCLGS